MIRIAIAVIGLVLVPTLVHGQVSPGALADRGVCPLDRPHKRVITQYPTMTTLVNCLPRMVCGSDRCAYESVQCNRAPEPVDVEICLSQDELDKAK